MSIWQLPDGIRAVVGCQAVLIESIRRKLIDFYQSKNYEFVMLPIVQFDNKNYTNNVLLEEKDFKIMDPDSARMMSIRSDVTLQISYIDTYKNNKISRFCYISEILQTKADDFYSSRNPIQAGIELYSSVKEQVDTLEVIKMMIESIKIVGFNDDILLCISDITLFNYLLSQENLLEDEKIELTDIVRRKSIPDLDKFYYSKKIINYEIIKKLINLVGNYETIIAKAKKILSKYPKSLKILNNLLAISKLLKISNINLQIDLLSLRTYEYHTGIIFTLYNKNFSKALAQGGEYVLNTIKERKACGFSFDLKYLIEQKTLKKNYD